MPTDVYSPSMSKDPSSSDPVQTTADGVGPLYHRVYEITFHAPRTSVEGMMAKLQADINEPSPQLLARFEKVEGDPAHLKPGDIFQIHITGPWNGPVRVDAVTPTSFRLITLEGHLEAGFIDFSARAAGQPDTYVFRIESRARSADRLIDLVYDKLGLAKAAQTEMWDEYCRAFAKLNHTDEERLEVQITTDRKNPKTGAWERLE